jgi:hypothetical protein
MSQSRINIHRGKKLGEISRKKNEIAKHLESGNEMNAKIWVGFKHHLMVFRWKH